MEIWFVLFLLSWICIQIGTITWWRRELAYRQETTDRLNRISVQAEESNSLSERLLIQGEETAALLKAIADNLEHRSIKN